ncbi:MAG: MarR family winged helix-turn-helix transcriptional regulator [Proteobacteria bacterium]|nr:MarR family winged helix-turn-helix transcriptional regulator [Pseudomonadota bacterium]
MRPKRPKAEQIFVWTGVVAQLVRTRCNQLLDQIGLPYSQFTLLLHFSHDPDREWTVTELADAFQQPQPGISKTVQKLVERRWLASRRDDRDGRVRWLRVTGRGLAKRDAAMARLAPDMARFLGGWTPDEVDAFHRLLERLKTDLDEARDAEAAG